jgi:hypothetical protein
MPETGAHCLKDFLTVTSQHRLHHTNERRVTMAYTLTAAAAGVGSKNRLDEWLVDPAELLKVLRIVGDEVKAHGLCALHIDVIAARAGVGRPLVQNALQEARELGLVTVQEPVGEVRRSKLVFVVSRVWGNMVALAVRFNKEQIWPRSGDHDNISRSTSGKGQIE